MSSSSSRIFACGTFLAQPNNTTNNDSGGEGANHLSWNHPRTMRPWQEAPLTTNYHHSLSLSLPGSLFYRCCSLIFLPAVSLLVVKGILLLVVLLEIKNLLTLTTGSRKIELPWRDLKAFEKLLKLWSSLWSNKKHAFKQVFGISTGNIFLGVLELRSFLIE